MDNNRVAILAAYQPICTTRLTCAHTLISPSHADSAANRKILSMLLQKQGLESDQGEDGLKGLEMVRG